MTELTTREKALVEAARDVLVGPDSTDWDRLESALRAYDPPKPKVYALPPWDSVDYITQDVLRKFCGQSQLGFGGSGLYQSAINMRTAGEIWGKIRELTAKEQE